MTTITQSMPGLLPVPSERQLAAVARAVRAVVEPDSASGALDSSRASAVASLRHAVAAYTQQMRRNGRYPEKALVAVKSTVRDVSTPMVLKPTVDALVSVAAQWCISAYFGES